ncbi:MAG: thiazole biosynthesis protein [candidate division Zixibacteria bacterium]|nr:thiazole biosynthesis protein [candidate division Zixibacteria bacterium]
MQEISDIKVTEAIISTYNKKLLEHLQNDVVIAGGGPSGLLAAGTLASKGYKVALFERTLSVGGGMWGGGIGYNIIVFQEEGKRLLDEIGVNYEKYEDGYYTADSIETVAALLVRAKKSGAMIFNLTEVEDVMVSDGRITGVVVNRSPITIAGLHVDPVSVAAKYVVEATGHPLEVLKKVVAKTGIELATPSGAIEGEKSMNAQLGEGALIDNTVEIAPGLYVAGMAANAAFGSFRMGPIFGGMLLSGEKVADEIDRKLSGN